MTLKKTLTISLILHICFFSAALLFSAGLLKGKGNLIEQNVIFVKLSADDNKAASEALTVDRKAVVPQKVHIAKKKIEPPVTVRKRPVFAKEDILLDKTDEGRDSAPKKAVVSTPQTEDPVSEEGTGIDERIDTDNVFTDRAKNGQDDVSREGAIVQAAYNQSVTDSPERAMRGEERGISSGIVELISMAIERVKTYPVIARKRGLEGTVHVRFRIGMDGRPEGIRILKSSGYSILDKATVSVVRKAAPYPHIDQPVEVPVAYKLRKRG